MKDFYKYLIIIFVGVVLFLLLNSQDNFNVGGIAWAALKPILELNIEAQGGWGEWDDYNYYFNNDLTENKIMDMFPSAKIIQGFPSNVDNVSRFTYKRVSESEDAHDYPWNDIDIEYIAFPPLFNSPCGLQPPRPQRSAGAGVRGWDRRVRVEEEWPLFTFLVQPWVRMYWYILGVRPSICEDQLIKGCGPASSYVTPENCMKCALKTCDTQPAHPALPKTWAEEQCGNCMVSELESYCLY